MQNGATRNLMLGQFDACDKQKFFALWRQTQPLVADELNFQLAIYFATGPLRKNPPDRACYTKELPKLRKYLESDDVSALASTHPDQTVQYFALPYVSDPTRHPIFKELFTAEWTGALRRRLADRLGVAELDEPLTPASICSSSSKTSDQEELRQNYKRLVKVTSELVGCLERSCEGEAVSPRRLARISHEISVASLLRSPKPLPPEQYRARSMTNNKTRSGEHQSRTKLQGRTPNAVGESNLDITRRKSAFSRTSSNSPPPPSRRSGFNRSVPPPMAVQKPTTGRSPMAFSSSNSSSTHSIFGAESTRASNPIPADPKPRRMVTATATSRATQTGDADTVNTPANHSHIPIGPQRSSSSRVVAPSRFTSAARHVDRLSTQRAVNASTNGLGQRTYGTLPTKFKRPTGEVNSSTQAHRKSTSAAAGGHPKEPSSKTVSYLNGSKQDNKENHSVVMELNYAKTTAQLTKNNRTRSTALLLQALRQQVTCSSSLKSANEIIAVYAERDLLALKNRKNSVVAVLLVREEEEVVAVKEQLARLLNGIASFRAGRDYLLSCGGGKDLLSQISLALKCERVKGEGREHALAALQKLSIRATVQKELVLTGVLEWLINYLSGGIDTPAKSKALRKSFSPSPFAMEYGLALVENLCCCGASHVALIRFKDAFLQTMRGLLAYNDPLGLGYTLRILYFVLQSVVRIRQTAKERGDLEPLLRQRAQRVGPELQRQCRLVLAVLDNTLQGEGKRKTEGRLSRPEVTVATTVDDKQLARR